MIDFKEVHRQADLIAKERVKDKKYTKKILDELILKAAHEKAYWDVINEINRTQELPAESVKNCLCKRVKALFK